MYFEAQAAFRPTTTLFDTPDAVSSHQHLFATHQAPFRRSNTPFWAPATHLDPPAPIFDTQPHVWSHWHVFSTHWALFRPPATHLQQPAPVSDPPGSTNTPFRHLETGLGPPVSVFDPPAPFPPLAPVFDPQSRVLMRLKPPAPVFDPPGPVQTHHHPFSIHHHASTPAHTPFQAPLTRQHPPTPLIEPRTPVSTHQHTLSSHKHPYQPTRPRLDPLTPLFESQPRVLSLQDPHCEPPAPLSTHQHHQHPVFGQPWYFFFSFIYYFIDSINTCSIQAAVCLFGFILFLITIDYFQIDCAYRKLRQQNMYNQSSTTRRIGDREKGDAGRGERGATIRNVAVQRIQA